MASQDEQRLLIVDSAGKDTADQVYDTNCSPVSRGEPPPGRPRSVR